MLVRTITAVVGFLLLLPVLIFSDKIVFPIFIGAFILVAMFEMFRCLGQHKKYAVTIPFYIIGAASPFAVRYLNGKIDLWGLVLIVLAIIILYLLAAVVISRNKITFSDVSVIFTSALYITFSFCGIVYLRDMENDLIYIFVFIGAWITDIFAYLCGRLFGKHKLIPDISPKKTVEGSIGGIVFCTAAFVGWAYIIHIEYVGIPALIIAGVIASCISQIGDLSMSAIKRQYGIKDYGKLFPGHGGVLDRFDSVLAVSSVMTVIFVILNHIHG